MSASPNKRKEVDLMKLMMSDYQVTMSDDSVSEFSVKFFGPKDSPYEGGMWNVRVELPPNYPYKSPSIGFVNKIYHPNVDFASGSICLDVINQTWTPMFDLINIFETFLPQLLLYPNPTDPLNGEAAALLLREPDRYKEKVRDCVSKYALDATQTRTQRANQNNNNNSDDDDDEDVSDLSDVDDGKNEDDLDFD